MELKKAVKTLAITITCLFSTPAFAETQTPEKTQYVNGLPLEKMPIRNVYKKIHADIGMVLRLMRINEIQKEINRLEQQKIQLILQKFLLIEKINLEEKEKGEILNAINKDIEEKEIQIKQLTQEYNNLITP